MEYVNKLGKYPTEFSKSFKQKIEETKTLFKNYEEHIRKPMVKCCVVGNVSAGKSTLINALLEEHILHEGDKISTLCAAICQSSSNFEEYFKIYRGNHCLDEHMPIEKVKEINHTNSDYSNFIMDTNNYLDIYLNASKYKILKKFILIDCPGFNDNNFDAISKYCKYADMIVFCFTAKAGITDKDIEKINRIKSIIGKFQISFIINCFHEKELNKNAVIIKSTPLLTNEHAIYFISAKKERDKMVKAAKENLNDARGGDFELFKNCLQNQKSLAAITYKKVYLDLICSVNELLNCLNCVNFQNDVFSDKIFEEIRLEIFQLINNNTKKYYKDDVNIALMEYSDIANHEIFNFMKIFIRDHKLNDGIIDDNYFYKRFIKSDLIEKPSYSWYNWGVKNDKLKKYFLDNFSNNLTRFQKEIMKHYRKMTEKCLIDLQTYKNELQSITNSINELGNGFYPAI